MFHLSYIIINQHDLQSVDKFVPAILDDTSEFGDLPNESDDGLDHVSPSFNDISFVVSSALGRRSTLQDCFREFPCAIFKSDRASKAGQQKGSECSHCKGFQSCQRRGSDTSSRTYSKTKDIQPHDCAPSPQSVPIAAYHCHFYKTHQTEQTSERPNLHVTPSRP